MAIPVHPLHQPAAVLRQVVADLGNVQAHILVVDDIHVGLLADSQTAAIVEAEEIRGFAGLAAHHQFQRQPLPT